MSKAASVAKVGATGLSAATLAYLLTLFVTRTEFKKVENEIDFNKPDISAYNENKLSDDARLKALESEAKMLLQRVAQLEALKRAEAHLTP